MLIAIYKKEISMNQKKTYGNCSYFDIHNLCSHRKDVIMIDIIHDISTEDLLIMP